MLLKDLDFDQSNAVPIWSFLDGSLEAPALLRLIGSEHAANARIPAIASIILNRMTDTTLSHRWVRFSSA